LLHFCSSSCSSLHLSATGKF